MADDDDKDLAQVDDQLDDQADEPDDDEDDDDDDDELDDDFDLSGVAPASAFYQAPEGYRSGFASFVGRPNAGKSTLTNALVGQKIVITSSKPQTTRNVVRGIVHRDDAQLILVDTPGLHRPRTLLGERLNDLVRTTWAEVDVVAVCFPANEKIGPGDRYLVGELAKVRRTTRIAVATKTDLATPEQLGQHLLDIAALGVETGTEWAEVVPVSAVAGDQVDLLADLLVGLLPEGPPLYPDGDLTDAPEEALAADLIREAALEGVRDELPHSIAVVVEEMGLREGRPDDKPLLDIVANLYVERDSQKGIMIGHKGSRLRSVGTAARHQIEALLGTPVYLDLQVKIAKDWQRDPRQLRKLGF
jgi:GTPase